jgi:hypothetical protein
MKLWLIDIVLTKFHLADSAPKYLDDFHPYIRIPLDKYFLAAFLQKLFRATPTNESNNHSHTDLIALDKHLQNNFDSFGNQLHTVKNSSSKVFIS